MIPRLLALVLLCVVLYVLGIFLFPSISDQYGNPKWNQRIREMKSNMESYTGSNTSIFDTLKNTTQGYIDESQSTVAHIQQTVETKAEEIRTTAESVQNAYNAVEKAKNDIQKLGTFSSSGKVSVESSTTGAVQ